jgi:hypothetical protein
MIDVVTPDSMQVISVCVQKGNSPNQLIKSLNCTRSQVTEALVLL